MASEDPTNMFADMKKKKKKAKVAFNEEPQVAEAESKEPIDDPSLGPATAHERALQNQDGGEDAGEGEVKALFGDLKKKKKKKEIPADLVCNY
jgi:translation initiation factor 2 subunit 2